MDIKILLLLSLSASLVGLLVADESEEQQPLIIELDGHHIEAPLFDKSITEMPQQRIDFDVQAVGELNKIIMNLTRDTIVSGKSYIRLLPYSRTFVSFIKNKKAEIKKLVAQGYGPDFRGGFTKGSIAMMKLAFKNSRADMAATKDLNLAKKSSEEKKLEAQVFMKDMEEFLDTIQELIRASPVGLYLDWKNVKIDGVPVPEIAPRYINFFKERGYGVAISLAETVVALIERLEL